MSVMITSSPAFCSIRCLHGMANSLAKMRYVTGDIRIRRCNSEYLIEQLNALTASSMSIVVIVSIKAVLI